MAFVRPATPFVARAPELARLRELIEAAGSGAAAAVLVAGDAGVGKTSLVSEATRRAADEGALVMLGRCVDLGTGALPYLPFVEAFTSLVRENPAAAALVKDAVEAQPVLSRFTGDGPESVDRLALFEAEVRLLARLGDELGPVVLVLEDLHWADPASRDLLRFLLTRLGADRLLVIGTYRADDLHRRHPLRPLVAELQRLPRVSRLELQPFGPDDLAAFLGSVAGRDVPADEVRRISERSAGNAYFAEELLAAPGSLPGPLADVLLDKLERLSPAAQTVVRAASVLGSARVDDGQLRAVAGVDEAALREAVSQQVLVPDGPDRYAFRHALIQEAVYADLLPGERVRLHRAAAAGAATAQELARHSLAANDLPTALTASLAAAVEAVRRSAPGQALADYEQALQLWDSVSPHPAGEDPVLIGVAAAMAAGDAGLHHRAHALALDALRRAVSSGAGPEETARARASVAQHTYSLDRAVEARDVARLAVADVAGLPRSPARVRARLLEVRSTVALGEAADGLELIPGALAEARELGMMGQAAELLVFRATAEGMLGRPASLDRWAEARTAAEEAGDPATLARVVYNTALDLIDAGDYPAGIAALEDALDRIAAIGLGGSLTATQVSWQLMTARWQTGDVNGALAMLDRRVPPSMLAQLRVFSLPMLAARDPEALLAEGPGLVTDAHWDQQILQTARADALTWLGRGEEASDAAAEALRHVDAVNEPYALGGVAISTAAVAALTGSPEKAAPFLADARDRLRLGRPRRFHLGPEGLAWAARLDAEEARLHVSDTAAGWVAVAEAFAPISVYERGRALYRAAGAAVSDDRARARSLVAEARGLASGLGARPLVEALDDLARRARLESRGAAPDVLTRREADVMRLVAEGLTNRAIGERLFISEKTVSVHVSNVLAKIGAASRAEAVSIMDRRQLLRD